MKQAKTIGFLLLALTTLPAAGQEGTSGIKGRIKLWSDFDHRAGFHAEAGKGSFTLFYTETFTHDDPFRTAGVSGPFFLVGPFDRKGLINDLYNDRFSVSGTFRDQTGLTLNRDTLSDASPGLALMLPGGGAGLWFRHDGIVYDGGIWSRFCPAKMLAWEGTLTGTLRHQPGAPDEWYPETWENPGGFIGGAGTRLIYDKPPFFGGLTLLGVCGESILPGARSEILLRWRRGDNHLTLHGGISGREYRSAEGEQPNSLANAVLRGQWNPLKGLILTAGAEYTCDRERIPAYGGRAGIRYRNRFVNLSMDWHGTPDIQTGDLSLWTGFGPFGAGGSLKGEWPLRDDPVYGATLSLIWTSGLWSLGADCSWETDEPSLIDLSGRMTFAEKHLSADLGLDWVLSSEQEKPDFFCTIKYRF